MFHVSWLWVVLERNFWMLHDSYTLINFDLWTDVTISRTDFSYLCVPGRWSGRCRIHKRINRPPVASLLSATAVFFFGGGIGMHVGCKVGLHCASRDMPPLCRLRPPLTLLTAFSCKKLSWISLSSPPAALRYKIASVPTLVTAGEPQEGFLCRLGGHLSCTMKEECSWLHYASHRQWEAGFTNLKMFIWSMYWNRPQSVSVLCDDKMGML